MAVKPKLSNSSDSMLRRLGFLRILARYCSATGRLISPFVTTPKSVGFVSGLTPVTAYTSQSTSCSVSWLKLTIGQRSWSHAATRDILIVFGTTRLHPLMCGQTIYLYVVDIFPLSSGIAKIGRKRGPRSRDRLRGRWASEALALGAASAA